MVEGGDQHLLPRRAPHLPPLQHSQMLQKGKTGIYNLKLFHKNPFLLQQSIKKTMWFPENITIYYYYYYYCYYYYYYYYYYCRTSVSYSSFR